jgi:hypothetical protein
MPFPRILRVLSALPLACLCGWAPAADMRPQSLLQGASLVSATHLIEAQQGSLLSTRVAGVVGGGFETARGTWIGFDRWYSTKWQDARFTWMTELSPHVGVIWGLSTGERGEKYEIEPSLKLGFAVHAPVTRTTALSLRATSIFGGRLRERACLANYGAIGGVQSVNCRLAASVLPPDQTLGYLFNEKAYQKDTFSLQFAWHF